MNRIFLLIVAVSLAAGFQSGFAADPVIPSHYLTGPVSRDVAAALKRGQSEHRPVWIVAWDDKFQSSPEGKKGNVTDYNLRYFYQNPETKKLVSDHFIQVFTTTSNSAVSEWVDKDDKTHIPVYIVIGSDGSLLARKAHYANPDSGLKAVQEVVASLK